MRIGFDLDEVLCNIIDPLTEAINDEFGLDLDINVYEHYDFYANHYTSDNELNKKIADRLIELINYELYDNATSYKDMVKVLRLLYNYGHEIYIITARKSSYSEVTAKWLHRKKIPYNTLTLVGLMGCKKDTISMFNLDYFIDDHVINIEAALKANKKLHGNIFLIEKPWNKWYNDNRVIKINKSTYILEHINGRKISKRGEEIGIGYK